MLDLNDPHRCQRLQCFADGRAAYPETRHQIAFGWQESARLDFTLLDQQEQPVEDLVGEFPAANLRRYLSRLTHWYDEYTMTACAHFASR